MEELIRLAPTTPTCLSSNRYPLTSWPDFPWGSFRSYINFDMPQVYWLDAHNAAWQLDKSYHEFMSMAPRLPYIPTGSTWKQINWECTPADAIAFMDKAKELGLQAVNFWEYSRLRDLPLVWKAIAEYDYGVVPVPPEPEPIPEPEENMPDITKVKAARDALVEIYAKADEAATNLNDFIAEYEAQPPAPPVPPVPPTPPPPEPPATTWEMLVKPAQADDPRTKAFCYQVWNSTQGRLVEKVNANGKYIMQEYLSMGGARLTYNRGVKVRVYREIIDTEADGPIDYHELYVPLGDRGQRLFLLKADLMKLV
jgi:hypothetical protein